MLVMARPAGGEALDNVNHRLELTAIHWDIDENVQAPPQGGAFLWGQPTPRYPRIPLAASRPSNTAVTTRSDPRTMSPPANTLVLVV